MNTAIEKEQDVATKKRKSKKPTKAYDLVDFIVIKKKDKKTQKTIIKKLSSKNVKRGKVRRKKPTTLKKKVLKQRLEKKQQQEDKVIEVIEQIEDLKVSDNQAVQHSRNFRDYCNHFITQDIKHYSEVVLKDLFRYQENKFQQNPVKAKANKRYVVGFKEVKKFLVVERLKLIFIAPDLEKNLEIDKLVDEIKQLADKHKIPYVFAIKRRKLGYLLLKKVPVSIVGIFDYQGTTENVNNLLTNLSNEKASYKNKTK